MAEEDLWALLAKKYNGEASPEELERLERLVDDNGLSPDALATLEKLWHTPLASSATEKLSETIRLPATKRTVKPRYKAWLGYAAAIALFLLAAGWWISRQSSVAIQGAEQLATTTLQPKLRQVLPDGSVVRLNRNSSIFYDKATFDKKDRSVKLVGEAYFEVAHNEKLPFIVATDGKMHIKVLGTAFNVRAYAGEPIETTLIEGSIMAYDAGNTSNRVQLRPHEKLTAAIKTGDGLRFLVSRLPEAPAPDKYDETAWIQQKLNFDNQSLAELVPRFEAWFGVRIKITDPQLLNYRFSGEIEYETLTETLDAMKLAAPFAYTITTDYVQLTPIN